MKPPPPMLPAVGWVTASAKAVATAASTAVPPAPITSAPMREAISLCDETMPFCARVGTELAAVLMVSATATAAARSVRTFDMRRIIAAAGDGNGGYGGNGFNTEKPRNGGGSSVLIP